MHYPTLKGYLAETTGMFRSVFNGWDSGPYMTALTMPPDLLERPIETVPLKSGGESIYLSNPSHILVAERLPEKGIAMHFATFPLRTINGKPSIWLGPGLLQVRKHGFAITDLDPDETSDHVDVEVNREEPFDGQELAVQTWTGTHESRVKAHSVKAITVESC